MKPSQLTQQLSQAIHIDILELNTNVQQSISPIYAINVEQYQGGTSNNLNPIILAYDVSHFESLDTISEEDDTKAIDLVESVKLGEYTLAKKDIQHNENNRDQDNKKRLT